MKAVIIIYGKKGSKAAKWLVKIHPVSLGQSWD